MSDEKQSFPAQQQPKPGEESAMSPKPRSKDESQPAAGKLNGKVALITAPIVASVGRPPSSLRKKELM